MIRNLLKYWLQSRGQYLEKNFDYSLQSDDIFVNVGSGAFFKDNWISLDADTPHFRNRHHDAKLGGRFVSHTISKETVLPFAEGSVSLFYCSHVLEHFGEDVAEHLIEDMSRCLKPGGLVRIVVPNAELAYRGAVYSRFRYFEWNSVMELPGRQFDYVDHLILILCGQKSFLLPRSDVANEEKLRLKEAVTRMIDEKAPMEDVLNHITEGAADLVNFTNHVNWFTELKLKNMLNKKFSDVWSSSRNASLSVELQNREYFDRTHPQMSLFVEAIK